ncbi:uncharacterized protein LOC106073649 isoform X1 [Biomphalaria glabrata]|uniref:Uncharacterized protein LOC106073649 isoform X1 n=1 Tax=Biomphalaria glabrata TaxID=6526 RepID=A0A9W3BAY4_BIOGL|nr:uncharacterized protein LOC106073649 isoform X1 [Biomphalaria glabrata]
MNQSSDGSQDKSLIFSLHNIITFHCQVPTVIRLLKERCPTCFQEKVRLVSVCATCGWKTAQVCDSCERDKAENVKHKLIDIPLHRIEDCVEKLHRKTLKRTWRKRPQPTSLNTVSQETIDITTTPGTSLETELSLSDTSAVLNDIPVKLEPPISPEPTVLEPTESNTLHFFSNLTSNPSAPKRIRKPTQKTETIFIMNQKRKRKHTLKPTPKLVRSTETNSIPKLKTATENKSTLKPLRTDETNSVPQLARTTETNSISKLTTANEGKIKKKLARTTETNSIHKLDGIAETNSLPKLARTSETNSTSKLATATEMKLTQKLSRIDETNSIPKLARTSETNSTPKLATETEMKLTQKLSRIDETNSIPKLARTSVTNSIPKLATTNEVKLKKKLARTSETKSIAKLAGIAETNSIPKLARTSETNSTPKLATETEMKLTQKLSRIDETNSIPKLARTSVTNSIPKLATTNEVKLKKKLARTSETKSIAKLAGIAETNSMPKLAKTSETNSIPKLATAYEVKLKKKLARTTETNSIPKFARTTETNSIPTLARITETNSIPKFARTTETNSIPTLARTTETNSIPKLARITEANSIPKLAKSTEMKLTPKITKKPTDVKIVSAAKEEQTKSLAKSIFPEREKRVQISTTDEALHSRNTNTSTSTNINGKRTNDQRSEQHLGVKRKLNFGHDSDAESLKDSTSKDYSKSEFQASIELPALDFASVIENCLSNSSPFKDHVTKETLIQECNGNKSTCSDPKAMEHVASQNSSKAVLDSSEKRNDSVTKNYDQNEQPVCNGEQVDQQLKLHKSNDQPDLSIAVSSNSTFNSMTTSEQSTSHPGISTQIPNSSSQPMNIYDTFSTQPPSQQHFSSSTHTFNATSQAFPQITSHVSAAYSLPSNSQSALNQCPKDPPVYQIQSGDFIHPSSMERPPNQNSQNHTNLNINHQNLLCRQTDNNYARSFQSSVDPTLHNNMLNNPSSSASQISNNSFTSNTAAMNTQVNLNNQPSYCQTFFNQSPVTNQSPINYDRNHCNFNSFPNSHDVAILNHPTPHHQPPRTNNVAPEQTFLTNQNAHCSLQTQNSQTLHPVNATGNVSGLVENQSTHFNNGNFNFTSAFENANVPSQSFLDIHSTAGQTVSPSGNQQTALTGSLVNSSQLTYNTQISNTHNNTSKCSFNSLPTISQPNFNVPSPNSQQVFNNIFTSQPFSYNPVVNNQPVFTNAAVNNHPLFNNTGVNNQPIFNTFNNAAVNNQPLFNKASVNEQPIFNTFNNAAINNQSVFSNANVNNQPVFNNAAINSQPVFNNAAINSQPVFNNAAINSQPVFNNAAINSQPVFNNAAINSQPVFNNAAINSQPVFNNAAVNNQPAFCNAAINNQPVLGNAAVNNQPVFGNVAVNNQSIFNNAVVNNQPVFNNAAANHQSYFNSSVYNGQPVNNAFQNCQSVFNNTSFNNQPISNNEFPNYQPALNNFTASSDAHGSVNFTAVGNPTCTQPVFVNNQTFLNSQDTSIHCFNSPAMNNNFDNTMLSNQSNFLTQPLNCAPVYTNQSFNGQPNHNEPFVNFLSVSNNNSSNSTNSQCGFSPPDNQYHSHGISSMVSERNSVNSHPSCSTTIDSNQFNTNTISENCQEVLNVPPASIHNNNDNTYVNNPLQLAYPPGSGSEISNNQTEKSTDSQTELSRDNDQSFRDMCLSINEAEQHGTQSKTGETFFQCDNNQFDCVTEAFNPPGDSITEKRASKDQSLLGSQTTSDQSCLFKVNQTDRNLWNDISYLIQPDVAASSIRQTNEHLEIVNHTREKTIPEQSSSIESCASNQITNENPNVHNYFSINDYLIAENFQDDQSLCNNQSQINETFLNYLTPAESVESSTDISNDESFFGSHESSNLLDVMAENSSLITVSQEQQESKNNSSKNTNVTDQSKSNAATVSSDCDATHENKQLQDDIPEASFENITSDFDLPPVLPTVIRESSHESNASKKMSSTSNSTSDANESPDQHRKRIHKGLQNSKPPSSAKDKRPPILSTSSILNAPVLTELLNRPYRGAPYNLLQSSGICHVLRESNEVLHGQQLKKTGTVGSRLSGSFGQQHSLTSSDNLNVETTNLVNNNDQNSTEVTSKDGVNNKASTKVNDLTSMKDLDKSSSEAINTSERKAPKVNIPPPVQYDFEDDFANTMKEIILFLKSIDETKQETQSQKKIKEQLNDFFKLLMDPKNEMKHMNGETNDSSPKGDICFSVDAISSKMTSIIDEWKLKCMSTLKVRYNTLLEEWRDSSMAGLMDHYEQLLEDNAFCSFKSRFDNLLENSILYALNTNPKFGVPDKIRNFMAQNVFIGRNLKAPTKTLSKKMKLKMQGKKTNKKYSAKFSRAAEEAMREDLSDKNVQNIPAVDNNQDNEPCEDPSFNNLQKETDNGLQSNDNKANGPQEKPTISESLHSFIENFLYETNDDENATEELDYNQSTTWEINSNGLTECVNGEDDIAMESTEKDNYAGHSDEMYQHETFADNKGDTDDDSHKLFIACDMSDENDQPFLIDYSRQHVASHELQASHEHLCDQANTHDLLVTEADDRLIDDDPEYSKLNKVIANSNLARHEDSSNQPSANDLCVTADPRPNDVDPDINPNSPEACPRKASDHDVFEPEQDELFTQSKESLADNTRPPKEYTWINVVKVESDAEPAVLYSRLLLNEDSPISEVMNVFSCNMKTYNKELSSLFDEIDFNTDPSKTQALTK